MRKKIYVDFSKMLADQQKINIVFFGDSITSCEWVHPNWPSIVRYVLEEELTKDLGDWKVASWGIRTFNAALNGGTSQDMLDYLEDYVLNQCPTLLVYAISSNDRLFNFSDEQFRRNLLELLEKTGGVDYRVVLSTISSGEDEKQKQMDGYYKELDHIFPFPGVQFVDLYKLSESFPKERIYTFRHSAEDEHDTYKMGDIDTFHPNRLGNAYIASVVLKEVFGIDFDPEKYTRDTFSDLKYPRY